MFHDGKKMNGALRHHQSTNAEYLSKKKMSSFVLSIASNKYIYIVLGNEFSPRNMLMNMDMKLLYVTKLDTCYYSIGL